MPALDTLAGLQRASFWSVEEWKVLIAGEDYEGTAEWRAAEQSSVTRLMADCFTLLGISSGPLGLKLAQPLNQKEKN